MWINTAWSFNKWDTKVSSVIKEFTCGGWESYDDKWSYFTGTEPLVHVMVETEIGEVCTAYVEWNLEVVEKKLA